MKIIVQKFGGTSVSTKQTRNTVIKKIINSKKNNNNVVVIVSAIGRTGDPYATDTLINFLKANSDDVNPREMDILLSCGELISAVVLASMLENKGYRAMALTGGQAGIITDDQYQNAEITMTKSAYILELLEKDIIPVVAGFQGMTSSGQITTLGRGGSDTSAAIIATSINADAIEIYTDVDGIMTADPRMCEGAHVIPKISYKEVFQMADSGAKVIHPRAVEIAMNANIPLIIKNTFSNEDGTLITQNIPTGKKMDSKGIKVITGIAHRLGRLQVQLMEGDIEDENLFQVFA
ncbi:MAG TPA: aspartate kinase, partial [Epulopiscium sp.]|nr:aspartate kinase [Candidatus Epulonipiscium sp.]